ncbi:ATP-binding cassette domain-containing protein [Psychrobacillus sp. OK032]|uniref:branched-chain amino acid ABC transporter ATP-binding protein/permease n=1 Tax=Psychrobacillus sp. OK032 TaxID=1884358 RepID=UPI0008C60B61|nr:branched-chain amino acid ABC transporter ATP-binding protein/permease [Psychrobacillus sp. OK032]SER56119.1 amino acid/amide ABC transporter membrane protein 2, HAAT family /amino acid/amide ABC transporter ATP-binding protein 1, HAAT family [Psychrobacillus sp. OK032]
MIKAKWWIYQIGIPLVLLYAFPWFFNNAHTIHVAQTFLITYIVIVGLNLLVGLSNQLSLGHVGFYAIGAYASAILTMKVGLNFFASILISALIAAVFGAIVALLSLRAKGPYLAMVTIAFGELVSIIANRWVDVTGGPAGIKTSVPSLFGFELGPIQYMWFIGLLAIIFTAGATNIFRGRFGRTFTAFGNSEVASEVLGINVRKWKILAFSVSAFLAGVGGGLFAFQNQFISSTTFELNLSIMFLIAVIIGGSGTKIGPIIGTVVIIGLPQFLHNFVDYHLMIFGGILLIALILLPDGIVGALTKLSFFKKFSSKKVNTELGILHDDREATIDLPDGISGKLLELQNISMHFGGLKAIDDVEIEVLGGTVHGIIGPNGSGKSTTVNVLSGVYMPSGGNLLWKGKNITKYAPHGIAQEGITRTFQNLQLFEDMSVLQNVMVGFHRHFKTGFLKNLLYLGQVSNEERYYAQKAYDLLRIVGLEERAYEKASDLPYGEQRLVEIARGLALKPDLLILDEPAAGASPKEIEKIMDVIQRLKNAGLSIILVEHHMDIVMNICDYITVLDFGKKICEGTPETIQNDPRVIEAYLGGEEVNQLVAGTKFVG